MDCIGVRLQASQNHGPLLESHGGYVIGKMEGLRDSNFSDNKVQA